MARNINSNIRITRRTLLAVGEGKCDRIFLNYLRSIYCSDSRGVQLKTHSAGGKSPNHIINQTVKFIDGVQYDKRLAFLDSDVEITISDHKKAKKHKIILVISKPCLEGMLLRILGQEPPLTAIECKKELKKCFPSADFTTKMAYEKHFPVELIDSCCSRVSELDQLIKLLKGDW